MPRHRAESLTEDLFERLRGAGAASRSGEAIVVCTVAEDGWPHPAMLSYFEVAAIDRLNLRLAVYTNSRTCANMRERAKATLIVADPTVVCYISGTAGERAAAMREAPYNAKLDFRIHQVLFDEPPPDLEPGVRITSGITHSARTPAALARAHAVLAELLE